MSSRGIKIFGAVLLVVVSGVATFLALNSTNPTPATDSTSTSNSEKPEAPAETPEQPTATTEEELKLKQQDATTKELMSSIAASLNNYSINNRGGLPRTVSQLTQFVRSYLSDVDFTNPATNAQYQLLLNPSMVTKTDISYQPGFTCSTEDTAAPAQPGTASQYALSTILPSGIQYCLGT